jgi:hypothetical protein
MLVLLANVENSGGFLGQHSGELTILVVIALVLLTLLILVPQLLRSHQRTQEMQHTERLKALEQGQLLPRTDWRSMAAGRTSSLVPMVVVCAAATVTCFLAAYKPESLFAVTLAVWSVAGVVSLAAITGGVALMGRLAQLYHGEEDEDLPENPLEK